LQAVYLRGTTYLQTPLFGIIPVVTLFVKGAEAVGTLAVVPARNENFFISTILYLLAL